MGLTCRCDHQTACQWWVVVKCCVGSTSQQWNQVYTSFPPLHTSACLNAVLVGITTNRYNRREFIVSLIKQQQRKCMSPLSTARGFRCERRGLGRMTTSQQSGCWLSWGIFPSTPHSCAFPALAEHAVSMSTGAGSRAGPSSRLLAPCPRASACLGYNELFATGLSLFSASRLKLPFPHTTFRQLMLTIPPCSPGRGSQQCTALGQGNPSCSKGHCGTRLPSPTSPAAGDSPRPRSASPTHPHNSTQTVTYQSSLSYSKTLDSQSTTNYRPSLWANCKTNSEQNHAYFQPPWADQSPKILRYTNLCTFLFTCSTCSYTGLMCCCQ